MPDETPDMVLDSFDIGQPRVRVAELNEAVSDPTVLDYFVETYIPETPSTAPSMLTYTPNVLIGADGKPVRPFTIEVTPGI